MSKLQHFFKFADTVGDGTGDIDAIDDYGTGQAFKVTCPDGWVYRVARMIVVIADGPSFAADKYGNLAALTNGIELKLYNADGTERLDLTGGFPIKQNGQWNCFCFDTRLDDYGAVVHFLSVRWSFDKSGLPLLLNAGDHLDVEMNDDLTGLITHTFNMQGERGLA